MARHRRVGQWAFEQVFGREVGRAALILTMAMMVLVSLWTALTEPELGPRWFA